MKRVLTLAAFASLLYAAKAQVPTTATPVVLKQINTLAGITTWTFSDSAGKLMYLQMPAYFVLQIPGASQPVVPLPAPAIWTTTTTAPPPPPPPTGPTASPDKTAILNNDGKTIYDAKLNAWTVVNGVVLMNGKTIGYSSGVVKLVIVGGILWQQNIPGNWYYWSVSANTWNGGAAPI